MQPLHLSRTLQPSKQLVLLIAFLASAFALSAVGFVSSTAQSAQEEEREIEDTIPKHLPINIKVKNVDKVKDSKNEKWARDMEIEVENRSNRPIYYLRLIVSLPDVKTENNRAIAFPLEFGRGELYDYSAPLRSDDVTIRPGDSYTFKIPEQLQKGWERFVTRRNLPKKGPKKILLRFQMLNFGDGTGFNTTGGLPVDVNKKQADNSCADGKKEEDIALNPGKPPSSFPALSPQSSARFLPATFSAGKFLSGDNV